MDDAVLVCGFERLGDLPSDREGFINWNRSFCNAIGERRSLDQLHHQGANSIGFLEAVNDGDVGMTESGERPGFSLEPGNPFSVLRNRVREHLDRDLATEGGVGGAPHLAHPTRTDRDGNFVSAETSAGRETHSL